MGCRPAALGVRLSHRGRSRTARMRRVRPDPVCRQGKGPPSQPRDEVTAPRYPAPHGIRAPPNGFVWTNYSVRYECDALTSRLPFERRPSITAQVSRESPRSALIGRTLDRGRDRPHRSTTHFGLNATHTAALEPAGNEDAGATLTACSARQCASASGTD